MDELLNEATFLEYSYTTTEVSQYYGLTGKGLEFYEKKGLISPGRQSNGKYRKFSLEDCYHLYYSKFYKNCGFNLDDIVSMLENKNLDSLSFNIGKQAKLLEKEAKYKERLSFKLNTLSSKLEDISSKVNRFAMLQRPPMYRLYVRNFNDVHESNKEESEEFRIWNENIPINVASLKFSSEEIKAKKTKLNTGIGNIILAEDFYFLNFKMSERVEYLPPKKCLHTIISMPDTELDFAEPLKPSLEYMKKNDINLSGDPISAMLIIANTNKGNIRYDEIWFPI